MHQPQPTVLPLDFSAKFEAPDWRMLSQAEATPVESTEPAEPVKPELAPSLDDLAQVLGQSVSRQVVSALAANQQKTTPAHYEQTVQELTEDNILLAKQIEQLIADNDTLRQECRLLQETVLSYRPVFGSLYLLVK